MNFPVEVEPVSFDSISASGREIDSRYLVPLRLMRDDVLLVDTMQVVPRERTEERRADDVGQHTRVGATNRR